MPVQIQTDCANVVNCLKEEPNRSYLGHLVNEVGDLISGVREFVVIHINRECNRVADRLAIFSRVERLSDV